MYELIIAGIIAFSLSEILGTLRQSSYKPKDYNKKAGKAGEKKITKALRKRGFTTLYDLNVPTSRFSNKTTQIDVIAISGHNIFCIEVKHYAGKVQCNRIFKHAAWLQCSKRLGWRFFKSPLAQNAYHVANLKKHIDYPIYNIVVFTASAELKNMPDTVYQFSRFTEALENLPRKNDIDSKTMDKLYSFAVKE